MDRQEALWKKKNLAYRKYVDKSHWKYGNVCMRDVRFVQVILIFVCNKISTESYIFKYRIVHSGTEKLRVLSLASIVDRIASVRARDDPWLLSTNKAFFVVHQDYSILLDWWTNSFAKMILFLRKKCTVWIHELQISANDVGTEVK